MSDILCVLEVFVIANKEVVIYNKTKPLFSCEFDFNNHKNHIIKITHVYEENKQFLPYILYDGITLEKINDWFTRRLIPEYREGYNYFFSYIDKEKIFNSHYANLTDQYWLKLKSETVTKWSNINFFNNKFDDNIGKLFFSAYMIDKKNLNYKVPDFATNGILKKQWIIKNNKRYLIKAYNNRTKQEPLNEYLATYLLENLYYTNYVKYKYFIYNMQFCSICENFIDENSEFVPAIHLYSSTPKISETESVYDHLIKACEYYKLDFDYKKEIDNMIAFDSLIGNYDRHLGNFGFIRDVENNKITSFAPLFDFGNAFWMLEEPKIKIFEEEESRCFDHIKQEISILQKDLYSECVKIIDNYFFISEKKRKIIKDNLKARLDRDDRDMNRAR